MIIILRVARGQAWDNEMVSADHLSSMKAEGGRKLGSGHGIAE